MCALRVTTSSTILAFVIACCLALSAWSAGAQEAADRAEEEVESIKTFEGFVRALGTGVRKAADNAEEKEELRPIDEQLWDAVAAQDRELVTKLLGQGADGGTWVDKGGSQAESIQFTFRAGRVDKRSLQMGTSNIGYSYRANTALKKAAKDGSSEMVRLLLAAGADDADDVAFQHAVRKGHIDVVRDFLIARSDNRRDWEGPVVCGESCRDQYREELGGKLRGHLLKAANAEAFSLFRQVGLVIDSDDLSPEQASALLIAAINQDDAEVALMAVAGGADPNFTGSNGIPALVAAVERKMSPQVVTALLDAGADVNAKVTGKRSKLLGFTALHFAADRGNDGIVAVLLEGEAAIDAPVSDGAMGPIKLTPLMLAAASDHAAVVRTLIRAGADVNAKMTGKWSKVPVFSMLRDLSKVRGFTALHFAATKGNDDIVAILLEGEAAIDPVSDGAMGSSKATPLMLAANKGHAAVVRTLISAGADVKLNVSGVTALKVTKKEDIRRMLRDAQKRRD